MIHDNWLIRMINPKSNPPDPEDEGNEKNNPKRSSLVESHQAIRTKRLFSILKIPISRSTLYKKGVYAMSKSTNCQSNLTADIPMPLEINPIAKRTAIK